MLGLDDFPWVILKQQLQRACSCSLECGLKMQENSYFALHLPHGWWLFGLDLALVDDIDMCQCRCTCPSHSLGGKILSLFKSLELLDAYL